MKIRVKMGKVFLFLMIFMFLFFLVSCKTDAQKTIEGLEARIAELEEEQNEEIPQNLEENSTIVEAIEESQREFSLGIAGSLYLSGYTSSVYVDGDYAYVNGNNGLGIIDISDKENPAIIGSTESGWAMDFYVVGNDVYLPYGNWDNEGNLIDSGFQIIDITNREDPTIAGTFESNSRIVDISAIDNYVYATYEILEQKEDYFQLTESGILIIDVTDKENISSVGIYDTGESGANAVSIEGNHLYFITGNSFKVLDVTNRESLTEKGSYSLPGWPRDFCVKGNYAYIPATNSLQIIDISDKENPTVSGGAFTTGEISDVFIEEDYAYIVYMIWDGNQIKESGMQIIDISDKKNPTVVTGIKIPGEALGIFVSGDYAYVGAGQIGLQIIDLFAE